MGADLPMTGWFGSAARGFQIGAVIREISQTMRTMRGIPARYW